MLNELLVLLFFGIVFSTENYIYQHVVTSFMNNEIDIMVMGYRMNYCYKNSHLSRKLSISEISCALNRPCMLVKPDGIDNVLHVRKYTKGTTFCNGTYDTYALSLETTTLTGEEGFGIFIEGFTFQKKFSFQEELFPEMPENNGRVVECSYNFEDNGKCTNSVQKGYIRTSVCAKNFLAFGDAKSVDDLIMLNCDESYAYVVYHGDLECNELLFISKFYSGLQAALQTDLCLSVKFINDRNIIFKCVNQLPLMYEHKDRGGYFDKDTMGHPYSLIELYHKPNEDLQKTQDEIISDGWECKGDEMVLIPSQQGTCSGNQMIFANESLFVIHIYDENDENCVQQPQTIHIGELEKLKNLNRLNKINDDICIDYWIGDAASDKYYRKFTLPKEYSINQYKNNIAIIPSINCDMEASQLNDLVIQYKKDPVRNFMIASYDFCISRDALYYFGGEDFVHGQAYRGYCEDGLLKVFFYNEHEDYCQGYPTDISNTTKNNGICVDNHFITCLNYICYDIEAVNPNVCNGRGDCSGNDHCVCEEGYGGEECEIDTNLQTGIIVSVTISSLISVSIILIILVILIIVLLLLIKSRQKLSKFNEVEDIEIILSEQKLEKEKSRNASKTLRKIKIDKSLFEIQREDLNLISIIGEGGSDSVVYLTEWKAQKCAYKAYRYSQNVSNEEDFFKEFEKEVQLFSSLHHPSILQFFGACVNPPNVGILLQYCKLGDLSNYLGKYKSMKKGSLRCPLLEKIRILREISTGMYYLHSLGILHRDLKPENVLIDDNEHVRIMDFGLAKLNTENSGDKTMTKRIGTSYYMAPEVFVGNQYSELCDVFSFSILCYVVITEKFFPYGSDISEIKILNNVASKPDFRPIIKKEEFKECEFLIPLMKRNWKHKHTDRNSFKEISELLKIEEKKMKKKNKETSENLTTPLPDETQK